MTRRKREFGEGPIFTITNYLFWFLTGNLYFGLVNIPLIILFVSIISNGRNPLPEGFSLIAFICCIPVGPALAGLFGVMGKLVREKDINITKDFFMAYKTNFLQALFLCSFEIFLIAALYSNITIIISGNLPVILSIFIYIMIVLVFMMGLFMFPIQSRFYLRSRDIMRLAVLYTVKRLNITFLNFAVLAGVVYAFFKISPLIIAVIPSVFCYLIMFNDRKILIEIEDNLKISG